MATDLEDISFKTLHPIRYQLIKDALKKNDLSRKSMISKVKKVLKTKFRENNIDVKITGREKRIFSIYQKMKQRGSVIVRRMILFFKFVPLYP